MFQRSATRGRTAIIDIGSNSVRLVVYEGVTRVPVVLFNEKVMAGLGRSLSATGAIDDEAMAAAIAALARYAWLVRELGVERTITVATAAVRDASNGALLIDEATALGLEVELLSGNDEANAAGLGVLSAMPEADGIVGDLGGGSVELARVVAGAVTDRASFPLGTLRLGAIRAKGRGALARRVAKLLDEAGWRGRGQGLPFYLVGGSWRALARIDMHLTGYPLPVIHGYPLSPPAIARFGRAIGQLDRTALKAIADLSSARAATLGDAAALLDRLMTALGSASALVSSFGLREGLLFARLDAAVRAEDPLIVAARAEGARLGRFAEHGDLIDRWVAPLFADEPMALARLRHAACLLADVGWGANPEFRAERGVEIALHGSWIAIDATGRALLAQALHSALSGATNTPEPLSALARPDDLRRAVRWGLAIRLAQRLSGGVAGPLKRTALTATADRIALRVAARDRMLYNDVVERRHRALAASFERTPDLLTAG